MSLDNLSAIINEKRDAAEAIRATFRAQTEHISNDETRSGMGKKSLTAEALRTTQRKIKELQDAEAKAVSDARAKLERQVFGTTITDPSGILAYRDAQARADELNIEDHDKAQAMLHAASLSADHTLASAVLSRSLALGWTDLIDTYKQQDPTKGDTLTDLLNLDQWVQSDSESLSGAFGAYFIGTPDALRGERETEIDRLANANGAPAVVTGNGHIWEVN